MQRIYEQGWEGWKYEMQEDRESVLRRMENASRNWMRKDGGPEIKSSKDETMFTSTTEPAPTRADG